VSGRIASSHFIFWLGTGIRVPFDDALAVRYDGDVLIARNLKAVGLEASASHNDMNYCQAA
jgi:hypothetical protein